jgi:hypothetical protein
MMLDIKNTSRDWKLFLQELAAEAVRDADTTPPEMALHNVLHDLSLVARAYAGRLDDVERGSGDDDLKQLVPDEASQLVTDAPSATPVGPVSPSELPDWLLETIRSMSDEIEALKVRLSALEGQAQISSIVPTETYRVDELTIFDEDRSAWNSVERARSALRGMIGREHQKRTRIRQAILARVTMLTALPGELTSDERAELRQHQDRAAELGEIDAIAGVKLDEIAGIDDLVTLREYDPIKGWPE